MGLMDFLSGATNAATAAATGQQEGQEKGSALMRQIMMQQQDMGLKSAQTRHANAQAAEGEYNVANPVARTSAQKAAEIGVLSAPTAQSAAATVTATAQPKADAHALDIKTTAKPQADADVLKQVALMPGVVQQAGAVEGAKFPYEIRKQESASNLTEGREKRLIPLHAQANADAYNLKPSDAERSSAGFAGPMAQSKAIIDRIGKPEMAAQILRKHGTWGNFLLSPEGQQFNQAMDQFVNSTMFATEGTRYSPEKEAAMRRQITPLGSTDPTVVANMESARNMLGKTVGIRAGRAKNLVHPDVQNALGWNDGQSGLDPTQPQAKTIQQPGTYTFGGKTYKAP